MIIELTLPSFPEEKTCVEGTFYSDQGHTSNNRNLINSIGYLCEQDLELTPPILPDRANLCGRRHPKIDQFHIKSLFFGKNLKKYL